MALSLHDHLAQNVAKAAGGGDADAADSPGPAGGADPTGAPAVGSDAGASQSAPTQDTTSAASEAPKGDRLRAADGKFAKPDAGASLTPPVDGQAKAPDPAVKPTDAAPDTGAPVLPPRGWGKETHDDWKALPRKLQERVVQRETERDRYLNQETAKVKQSQTYFQQLHEVIGPRTQHLIANFGGVAPAVARLFQLSDAADRAPADFIRWLANNKGIDLAQLVAGAPEPAAVDPHLQAMRTELGQLRQVVQGIGKTFQTNAQTQDQQAQNAVYQSLNRWAAETEADGQTLKRPYFERLEDDVLALLPRVQHQLPGASQSDLLQAAYDAAVYANPETRQAVLTQADNKREADRRAAAAKAALAASTAGASITGSTAPTGGSVPPKTVREGLVRNLAKARGMAA